MKHHRIVLALILALSAGSAVAGQDRQHSNQGNHWWADVSQAIVLGFDRFSAKATSIWTPPTKTKGGLELAEGEEQSQEQPQNMELGRLFPL